MNNSNINHVNIVDVNSLVDYIKRIEKEWDELGRAPNIGEIAMLVTTEKGEKEAENILRNRKNDNSCD